jgi:hypothetical protein
MQTRVMIAKAESVMNETSKSPRIAYSGLETELFFSSCSIKRREVEKQDA